MRTGVERTVRPEDKRQWRPVSATGLINTSQANSPAVNICNTYGSLGAASSSINFFRGDLLAAHPGEHHRCQHHRLWQWGSQDRDSQRQCAGYRAHLDQSEVVTVAKSVKTTSPGISTSARRRNDGSWACVNDAPPQPSAGVIGGENMVWYSPFTGWKIVVS
jgi:hypothetical protein